MTREIIDVRCEGTNSNGHRCGLKYNICSVTNRCIAHHCDCPICHASRVKHGYEVNEKGFGKVDKKTIRDDNMNKKEIEKELQETSQKLLTATTQLETAVQNNQKLTQMVLEGNAQVENLTKLVLHYEKTLGIAFSRLNERSTLYTSGSTNNSEEI